MDVAVVDVAVDIKDDDVVAIFVVDVVTDVVVDVVVNVAEMLCY